jgi:deazaflavin-dependent oxidoreductase (nitroreductase family)
MTTTVRIPFFVRLGNRMMRLLVGAGVPFGNTVLLTVCGRKSGQSYTNPVTILKQDGNRYIIAAYGMTSWVRNLRAAGEGTIKHARRTEAIVAKELSLEEAAPVLKYGLTVGPSILRRYFDVTPSSSLQDFTREAQRHPVFQILPAPAKAHAEGITAG